MAANSKASMPGSQQSGNELIERYERIRRDSESLCAPLAVEDYVVQTAVEVSPPKWHLAHTSWFFETFVLKPFSLGYEPFHPEYGHLFNSYYNTVGPQWPRPRRGHLSRPTVAQVYRYRAHVDAAMYALLEQTDVEPLEIHRRVELGLHHEQQHQELFLTDIKHIFSVNPLAPAYAQPPQLSDPLTSGPMGWVAFEGGAHPIGFEGSEFHFDNEEPRHFTWMRDFRLATRPVTNGEFLEFMEQGGYREPLLWLSDGWEHSRQKGWEAPAYWQFRDGAWWQMTLSGLRPVDPDEPVCHVSFFEADAFSRWAGHRLPSEFEWEVAAGSLPVEGNFRESGALHPMACEGKGLRQLFGDVWEWTASPYTAYPGYRPARGAFGEYNGKFMCNQFVLRGGSCASPVSHLRATYRNFFFPHERWQFSGIRLAD